MTTTPTPGRVGRKETSNMTTNLYDIKLQIAGFFVAAMAGAIWMLGQDTANSAGPENVAKLVALIAAVMILAPLRRGTTDG